MDMTSLKQAIKAEYGIEIRQLHRLEGGEKNMVYRIDHSPCVLRVYQKSADRSGIHFEHMLLLSLKEQLPYISQPYVTKSGTFLEIDGHPAAVMRYIDGVTPVKEELDEAFCHQAGTCLGEIHRQTSAAAAALPAISSRKSLLEMDFFDNDMYSWDTATAWLAKTKYRPRLPYFKDTLRFCESYFHTKKFSPALPIHGDYYEGNLLCRDGKIVGVIDFDDTKPEFPEYEIARSLWEFTRDDANFTFHPALREAYLSGYSRSMPVSLTEADILAVVGFVRIMEILSNASSMIKGDLLERFDEEYNDLNFKWSKKIFKKLATL